MTVDEKTNRRPVEAHAPAGPRVTWKSRIGRRVIPLLPCNRQTFDLLRFEANAAITRALPFYSIRHRRRLVRFRREDDLNLNLGSGGRGRPGWINVDIARHHSDQSIALDIRSRLPFGTQVRRVFAEHVVEHLEFREDVPRLFREIHRVLKPGGLFRIVVPDARRWIEAYLTNDPALWAGLGMPRLPDDMPTPMAMLNHVFHQGGEHHFAYDFETMEHVLRQAGFRKVARMSFGVSSDPESCIDREEHRLYSLYVEATKE